MANAHRRSLMAPVKINGWRSSISGLSFARLEAVERARLEEPFSELEVFEALKDFSGDKAPGPNGFSMAFWQSSWGFAKEEVMVFFREFHDQNCFVTSLNATFLLLILKKGAAEYLRDFRPIRLVGGLYKWLAKVLVNWLKLIVGKVVSKAQNAFEGRQIVDVALVANEVIDSILKSNEGAVLCKLDIEKAYDHMDWVGSLPSSYLGLPLGAPFKSVAIWDRVKERFRKTLTMWKRQYISKGGRLTLIQSTLASLPIYFMYVLTLPRMVRLRVRGLKMREGDFWNQVIRGKCGEEQGGWCSKELRDGYGVGLWKATRREWHVVSSKLSFVVSNGQRVKF
ncbi:hypothetical protein CK203_073990 [Vitis vinifera]|uniref:Uncharacterized protein n=1 Tax=Vitis vinifera TaxID=29760 RepID=A0A438DQ97_VITVI|nr:hypothetical protein CK203_073990 [Vitis vinifera]